MKEGRKYGVAVVVASQGLADFNEDVLKNVGTRIAFRANAAESRKIAQFFTAAAGQNVIATLESLSVGHALVQSPGMKTYAVTTMLQPDKRE